MGKYIMALDQGTTSSRCILFDRQGRMCASANKEYNQYYPQPGWVEHDPIEIWSSQASVALEAMNRIGASAADIQGIGITNQRETTIIWNRHSGQPIHRAIVWQCRRTAPMIDRLLSDGMGETIRQKTGLIPDAYFSGTKIRWILDHVPGAAEAAERGDLVFGTVESWLIWQLTGGQVHVTDYTNASRTMLFNIHTMDWDDEILSYLKIPRCMLPRVAGSSEIYGYTSERLTGVRIPIAGAAGDQQAALFGQCCFEPGDVKNTYGTGCFLLMNTGGRAVHSENGLLTTIAVNADGTPCYALEGSVFVAGAAIQWLRDELQLIRNAAESEFHCREVSDTNGVYVVPAFTGLGAPYWDQYARGAIVGLTRGVNRSHLIRATVESLAYQVSGLIRAMEKDSGIPLTSLKVDGGASANDFLMQFQADLLGRSVDRPACIETTAMGAAYLAGIATGFWNDIGEIRRIWQREKTFSPKMEEAERLKKLRGWEKAVRCTFEWAKDE